MCMYRNPSAVMSELSKTKKYEHNIKKDNKKTQPYHSLWLIEHNDVSKCYMLSNTF
jgi:hypothetical protein